MKKLTLVCGVVLALSMAAPAFAAESPIASQEKEASITFREEESGTEPGDNKGPLRLEDLQEVTFGEVLISGSTSLYHANYVNDEVKDGEGVYKPNYVQVKDNRGTNKGWTLHVSATPFKAEETELEKTTLKMQATQVKSVAVNPEDQTVVMPYLETDVEGGFIFQTEAVIGATNTLVATAENGSGMGMNAIFFGDDLAEGAEVNTDNATRNKDISLTVPGESEKDKDATYTSTLVWTIMSDASGS